MLLEKARKILKKEIAAIDKVICNLDNNFEKAINIMDACEGRVVTIGMGKPGIIAQKISATLSSTGIPSLFLHAAEAVHGDLGRVTNEDVIVILSNSGETEEVIKLIPFLKKIGSKIIAICGNPGSTLVKHSDCFLNTQVDGEADTMGLIPSSSTTAMLAIGDALALVLVDQRGIKEEDFALYHPGGIIGKKLLLTVGDLMRKGDAHAIIEEDQTVKEALVCITKARAGSATVVDGKGKFVGIFTDGDLRRYIDKDPDLLFRKMGTVMTRDPISLKVDDLAVEALKILRDNKIDEAPVIDDNNCPVGLVDVQDIIKVGIL